MTMNESFPDFANMTVEEREVWFGKNPHKWVLVSNEDPNWLEKVTEGDIPPEKLIKT